MHKDPIIGIDLGTTNSCAAIVEDGGNVKLIPYKGGEYTIPSIFAIDDKGNELIGYEAKRQWQLNPKNTIYGAKRLVGRTFQSDVVDADEARSWRTAMRPGKKNDVVLDVGKSEFTLQEISAKILNKIRDVASNHLKTPIKRAVVTVPAYFNDRQRQTVKDAGKLIDLEVVRIINEPTAAALAYGAGKGTATRRCVVYDLGGGTFDVSIIEIRDRVFEVKATGGDIFLGGIDFDNAIIHHVLKDFAVEDGHRPGHGSGGHAAHQGPRRAHEDRSLGARGGALQHPLHHDDGAGPAPEHRDEVHAQDAGAAHQPPGGSHAADGGAGAGGLGAEHQGHRRGAAGGRADAHAHRAGPADEVLRQGAEQGRAPGRGGGDRRGALRAVAAGRHQPAAAAAGRDSDGHRPGEGGRRLPHGVPAQRAHPQRQAAAGHHQHRQQTELAMRIYQGDNDQVAKNELLGEFTFSGIRPDAGGLGAGGDHLRRERRRHPHHARQGSGHRPRDEDHGEGEL